MNIVFKHSLIYFLGKGLPGLITFGSILLFSRYLTPDQYGVYSLVISAAGIINIIFFDWLRFGMSRYLPDYILANKRDTFLDFIQNTSLLNIGLLAILLVIIYLIGQFFDFGLVDFNLIPFVFIIATFQYLFTLYTQVFVTELKPLNFSIANILKSILSLLFSLIFLWNGFGYLSLIIGASLGFLIPIIYTKYKLKIVKLKFSLNKVLLREILLYSIPLTASAGLSFLLSYSSRFIINHFRGPEETGIFSLGFDFSQQSIGVFIAIAATSATPLAIKIFSKEGNSSNLSRHMNESFQLLLIISIPIVIIFITCSEDLKNFFLGKNFSMLDNSVLPLVSLSGFILGIKSYFLDVFFYLKKETKYQLLILLVVAISNIILNLFFIPKYGYTAALWIGLFVNSIAMILTFFVTQKLLPIRFNYSAIICLIIVGLFMLLVMNLVGKSSSIVFFGIKLLIGLGVYVIGFLFIDNKLKLNFFKIKR